MRHDKNVNIIDTLPQPSNRCWAARDNPIFAVNTRSFFFIFDWTYFFVDSAGVVDQVVISVDELVVVDVAERRMVLADTFGRHEQCLPAGVSGKSGPQLTPGEDEA